MGILKEEKELRKWVAYGTKKERKQFFKDIAAFKTAVRENCAILSENYSCHKCGRNQTELAAAIRGKRK